MNEEHNLENTMSFREFGERMVRMSESVPGSKNFCLCCGEEWIIGDWNFYGLCDGCFVEYDKQKYGGPFKDLSEREGLSGNDFRLYTEIPYFMSTEKWIVYKKTQI